MKLSDFTEHGRRWHLRLPIVFSIAVLVTLPSAASSQSLNQMCFVQQYIQRASEGDFTDPQFAHPVSDGTTECQVKYGGTNVAQFECTSSFHDAQTALAFAANKAMIFRHCFPGLQFQDGGQVTDSETGQKIHDLESSVFADYSWIEITYETTPDAKGIYHAQYVVHSPPG